MLISYKLPNQRNNSFMKLLLKLICRLQQPLFLLLIQVQMLVVPPVVRQKPYWQKHICSKVNGISLPLL